MIRTSCSTPSFRDSRRKKLESPEKEEREAGSPGRNNACRGRTVPAHPAAPACGPAQRRARSACRRQLRERIPHRTDTPKERAMSDSVYRVTEVIGTSPDGWEAAARNAVETAARSIRDLRIAEA